jgi:hypothetical protein
MTLGRLGVHTTPHTKWISWRHFCIVGDRWIWAFGLLVIWYRA